MLPHRSVLFYSDVGEKYALLLSYVYGDKKKIHSNLIHFHAKGTQDLKSLIYVSMPDINLCFPPIAAIHTGRVWPQSNTNLPAVIKSSTQQVRLNYSSVLTALLDHELFYFPFKPSLFALLLFPMPASLLFLLTSQGNTANVL